MKCVLGDRVFIIENGTRISEAEVIRCAAGFCTIRFRNGGGTRTQGITSLSYQAIVKAAIEQKRSQSDLMKAEWAGLGEPQIIHDSKQSLSFCLLDYHTAIHKASILE